MAGGDPPTLKEMRLRMGMSQTELATRISTSQPRIARLEAGKENPSLETAKKLANALDTDVNSIASAFS
jgi:predicted transcriptional regulator